MHFQSFWSNLVFLDAEVQQSLQVQFKHVVWQFNIQLCELAIDTAIWNFFAGVTAITGWAWRELVEVNNRYSPRLYNLQEIVDAAPPRVEIALHTTHLIRTLPEQQRVCEICSAQWNALEIAKSIPARYQCQKSPWIQVDTSKCTLRIDGPYKCVPLMTPCGHIFCAGCINWLISAYDEDVRCPICAADFGKKSSCPELEFLFKRFVPNGGFVEGHDDAHRGQGKLDPARFDIPETSHIPDPVRHDIFEQYVAHLGHAHFQWEVRRVFCREVL
jgi:hypothetical protein